MHYQILAQPLQFLGASPARPPRLSRTLRAGMAIVAEIAHTSTCDACGYRGLHFEAWHQGRLYFAAVARCPACQEAYEF